MEDDYSKREIDVFMKDIREQLDRIEAQTIKTNGRVSKLEIWQGFTKGGIAILAAMVVPILLSIINSWY